MNHMRNKGFSKDRFFKAKRPGSRAGRRFSSKEYDGRRGKYRPRDLKDASRSPGGRTYLLGKDMRTSLARGRTRSRSIERMTHDDKMKVFRRPAGATKKLEIKKRKPFERGRRPKRGKVFASIETQYCPRPKEECSCGSRHIPVTEYRGLIREREALCDKEWYPAYGYFIKRDHEGNQDDGWYPYEETYDDQE